MPLDEAGEGSDTGLKWSVTGRLSHGSAGQKRTHRFCATVRQSSESSRVERHAARRRLGRMLLFLRRALSSVECRGAVNIAGNVARRVENVGVLPETTRRIAVFAMIDNRRARGNHCHLGARG